MGLEGGVSEASRAHPEWLMLHCLWNCFLQANTMHFNPNAVPGPSPRRPNSSPTECWPKQRYTTATAVTRSPM